ncbi:hypothetical protein [Burkholderia ubonensis]|nr:hypothetical protein [Burkholderia ubonensis]
MRDNSRVTAEMMFDMISPTCLMIVLPPASSRSAAQSLLSARLH